METKKKISGKKRYVKTCVVFFIFMILAAIIYKKQVYQVVEQTDIPYKADFNSYTIANIDSTKMEILPSLSGNGDVKIRIECHDRFFLKGCSPIIVDVTTMVNGKNEAFAEYQYEMKYERNKIVLRKKELPTTDYIVNIGYYRYEEIADKQPVFHCVSHKVTKGAYGEFKMEDYLEYAPKKENGEMTVTNIVQQSVKCYVYRYDIDIYFNGFKDNERELLNENRAIILLKNGSRYEGPIKDGYFEGTGTFRDSLLGKEYKGQKFIKGNIERDSVVNSRTFIKIKERPLLSTAYPIGSCFRTDYKFTDSVNVKRTNYIYKGQESGKAVVYRQVLTFDKYGNVTGETCFDNQGNQLDESISKEPALMKPMVLERDSISELLL